MHRNSQIQIPSCFIPRARDPSKARHGRTGAQLGESANHVGEHERKSGLLEIARDAICGVPRVCRRGRARKEHAQRIIALGDIKKNAASKLAIRPVRDPADLTLLGPRPRTAAAALPGAHLRPCESVARADARDGARIALKPVRGSQASSSAPLDRIQWARVSSFLAFPPLPRNVTPKAHGEHWRAWDSMHSRVSRRAPTGTRQ